MDIYVYINGARKSLRQLSAESGVAYETVYARWKNGVPADKLVELPESEKPELPLTKEEVVNALGYAPGTVNPNLLDNWYFGNPVNQRGQTEYAGDGYYIDRWNSPNGAAYLKINNGFISFGSQLDAFGYLRQLIEHPEQYWGKNVTASILLAENKLVEVHANNLAPYESVQAALVGGASLNIHSSDASNLQIHIAVPYNEELNIIAAKLELGDTQTLAHQDASGNWVLNEIPNYAEQLAICSQYTPTTGEYKGVFSMDLLWENASPTSNFGAQTIALDLSGYSMVGIVCDPSRKRTTFARVGDDTMCIAGAYNSNNSINYFTTRRATISTSGIVFTAGTYTYVYDAGSGTGNGYCVPQAIYGIKGVA